MAKKKNKKQKDIICTTCMHGVFMLAVKFAILVLLTGIAAIGTILIRDIGTSNIDPIILWCFLASYVMILLLTIAIFYYSKNRNMFEAMSGLLFIVFLLTANPNIQKFAINFGIAALILQILSAFFIDIKIKINKFEVPLSYWNHERASQKGNKTK